MSFIIFPHRRLRAADLAAGGAENAGKTASTPAFAAEQPLPSSRIDFIAPKPASD
jgi:hypothetical protein